MKSSKSYRTACLVLLAALGLLLNHVWLAGRRHIQFREASWRALDSLAYEADELKKYQHQMTEMLFYGDWKPIADTFLLADPEGTVYTFDGWLEAVCPELLPGTEPGTAGSKDASDASASAVLEGADPPFVVVFRYTELDCMTCTERQIELIQQTCAAHPELKCVILASYAYDALLWQFVRMNQIELPIYQVPSDAVYGEVGVPFYFVLDRTKRYHHAFVPHKMHDEWTVAYLNELAGEAGRRK